MRSACGHTAISATSSRSAFAQRAFPCFSAAGASDVAKKKGEAAAALASRIDHSPFAQPDERTTMPSPGGRRAGCLLRYARRTDVVP